MSVCVNGPPSISGIPSCMDICAARQRQSCWSRPHSKSFRRNTSSRSAPLFPLRIVQGGWVVDHGMLGCLPARRLLWIGGTIHCRTPDRVQTKPG